MNQKEQIKQAIAIQFKKCAIDPIYFLKTYGWISHPQKGKIKFKLFQFQQKVLNDFINHSWNIILKSRQMGISTLCAGYILWFITFNADKTVLVIANKQSVAMGMIQKIKLMYDKLPQWMKEQLITNNKQSLQFANGSSVKASSANENAGVSQALSLLVFDEAAVLRENLAHQIWTSAQPALSVGGNCIMLSTPRGCVIGETKIILRNKKTGEIIEKTIQELYNETYV